jgi:transposase, IS5 family
MTSELIRDDDKCVYGDAGYTGIWKHLEEEKYTPGYRCCVAAKRGTIKKLEDTPMKAFLLGIEKNNTSIRAKAKHPFHVIKITFDYRKVRYKRLDKNQAQLFILFSLGKLVLPGRCQSDACGTSVS